ncbi:hypothetical protein [Mycolicibacterium mageritense]|uniref:hypothetical protein n=1 Tax=Mycolicibacterium mageritense TaxID=53462 RepID=UPI001E52CA13|nr:hypothetical protein [Mycolicibacterium mageritense]GJJ17823.1 hypothetical protein MTY414_14960 [Mycolicibacterium mageritense]
MIRAAARLWTAVIIAAAAALTGCASQVAGNATAPRPYAGPVSVEFAYTDSFDVLSGGKCQGRGINGSIRQGAVVEVISWTGSGARTTATIDVQYEENSDRRPEDDGRFCVARFSFVTPEPPSLSGYTVRSDTRILPSVGPPVEPTTKVVVQSCTDMDAPPELPCGIKYGP